MDQHAPGAGLQGRQAARGEAADQARPACRRSPRSPGPASRRRSARRGRRACAMKVVAPFSTTQAFQRAAASRATGSGVVADRVLGQPAQVRHLAGVRRQHHRLVEGVPSRTTDIASASSTTTLFANSGSSRRTKAAAAILVEHARPEDHGGDLRGKRRQRLAAARDEAAAARLRQRRSRALPEWPAPAPARCSRARRS